MSPSSRLAPGRAGRAVDIVRIRPRWATHGRPGEPPGSPRVRSGMAKRKGPSPRLLLAACDEIGPEDGIDPRAWAKAEGRRPPGRKGLQLCRQVAEALNGTLAGCRDDVLGGLVVTAVAP